MSYSVDGITFDSDVVAGEHKPGFKIGWGSPGSWNYASDAAPMPVRLVAQAAAPGLTVFRSIDVDETEEEISATPCAIHSIYLYNAATSKRFVKFYNATAAGTTVGTTTPVATYVLEADQGLAMALPHGLRFTTACCIAATTGIADNNTGAPGANEVIAVIGYV